MELSSIVLQRGDDPPQEDGDGSQFHSVLMDNPIATKGGVGDTKAAEIWVGLDWKSSDF